MPHYVTQLEREDEFAVYSTIVDNLITKEFTPRAMREWLAANDYDWWLTSDEPPPRMYWHNQGFMYVKLADAYYTLPRCAWRDE